MKTLFQGGLEPVKWSPVQYFDSFTLCQKTDDLSTVNTILDELDESIVFNHDEKYEVLA